MSDDRTTPPVPYETCGAEWCSADFEPSYSVVIREERSILRPVAVLDDHVRSRGLAAIIDIGGEGCTIVLDAQTTKQCDLLRCAWTHSNEALFFAVISGELEPATWAIFGDRKVAEAFCTLLSVNWGSEYGCPQVYYARRREGVEYWNGPSVADLDVGGHYR